MFWGFVMLCLDERIMSLAPEYSQRHEELFGNGRGRIGCLIYRRLTRAQDVDELDIYVERIRKYLDKSVSFLKKSFRRKKDGCFFKKPETPIQYLCRATIGFIITDRLSFYSGIEVSPNTNMKKLSLNEITIGSLRDAIEAKNFAGYMPNQVAVYQNALKKKVSYIIERFAEITQTC